MSYSPNCFRSSRNRPCHKVAVEYGTLGAIADRVKKGEAADVVIVTAVQNDQLQKEGKLLAGTRAEFAKGGYSALVKAGAATPDLATVETFKRTMLAAKSIAMGDPAGGGPLGVYSASLTQRLGSPSSSGRGSSCFHPALKLPKP